MPHGESAQARLLIAEHSLGFKFGNREKQSHCVGVVQKMTTCL
ncbi:hypothetical protein ACIO93_00230 [Streptomyces sp. NPDC087903]